MLLIATDGTSIVRPTTRVTSTPQHSFSLSTSPLIQTRTIANNGQLHLKINLEFERGKKKTNSAGQDVSGLPQVCYEQVLINGCFTS